MKRITINDAAPEMVLAKNVYGKNENLLMGDGTVLNSDSIGQLSRLGIQSLWIEAPDEEKEMTSEDIAKIKKEVEALLDAQFEPVSHSPIMQELKKVFTRYLIRKRSA
jgi:protein tyrosine phosphatase (PTP) superfamily phosphohydrolase (DUF442 family)